MARYGLIVYKWVPTTRASKTSLLATRDHCWDALRKETSITRKKELHMIQPTQGWCKKCVHEVYEDTCYQVNIGRM
mgnify:CR=1 FL=1